jgi:hypothetical protein
MSEQLSLQQFIEKHGLKFACHRVDSREDGTLASSGLAEAFSSAGMRHFRCRITVPWHGGIQKVSKSFGLYFSQGPAWTTDPAFADVLDCIASDASAYEGNKEGGFVEWAAESGYDTDSRAAERIYRTIKRQAEQLKRALGHDAYKELLWSTERL